MEVDLSVIACVITTYIIFDSATKQFSAAFSFIL